MSIFFFLGVMLILGLSGYTIWDLERKKKPLEKLASRMEHLAKGNDKIKFRHLRRTNLNAFSQERVLESLTKEVEVLEQSNGLESPLQKSRFMSFSKKIESLEERVAKLEQLMT